MYAAQLLHISLLSLASDWKYREFVLLQLYLTRNTGKCEASRLSWYSFPDHLVLGQHSTPEVIPSAGGHVPAGTVLHEHQSLHVPFHEPTLHVPFPQPSVSPWEGEKQLPQLSPAWCESPHRCTHLSSAAVLPLIAPCYANSPCQREDTRNCWMPRFSVTFCAAASYVTLKIVLIKNLCLN